MKQKSKLYRVVRIVSTASAGCAMLAGALFAWLFQGDAHWAWFGVAFGAISGLIVSLILSPIVIWPSARTIDATLAILFPVSILLAVGSAAWMTGSVSMLWQRKSALMLGAAVAIGGLRFVAWQREGRDSKRPTAV